MAKYDGFEITEETVERFFEARDTPLPEGMTRDEFLEDRVRSLGSKKRRILELAPITNWVVAMAGSVNGNRKLLKEMRPNWQGAVDALNLCWVLPYAKSFEYLNEVAREYLNISI